MTLEELRQVAASVGARRGWDFSRMRTARDPVPWDYLAVVRPYLHPDSQVLDIGTGGGEKFLSLAPYFGAGVGTDVARAMAQVARENTPPSLMDKVSFEAMPDHELRFPDSSFDIVLNRHAAVVVEQIARVLRPGGVFITQQVGGRNTQSIFDAFGWGSDREDLRHGWRAEGLTPQDAITLGELFREVGCAIIARAEYDVRYYFLNLESLVFWLKSVPLPEDFDPEKHWRQVDRIIAEHRTPQGIETNEHRHLLIVRKP